MDNKDILKGQNDGIILYILTSGDRHTDELKEIIDSLFNGIKIGTLYSVISRLKTQQFISEYRASSVNGSRRKYYKLTNAGKKEFEEKYASIYTDKLELPVKEDICEETYFQPTKRTKTTKTQIIESENTQIQEQITTDSDDYASYINSVAISPTETDIDFSTLEEDNTTTQVVNETLSENIEPSTTSKKTAVNDTFTIDDYNLKKDMEKEEESAKIGVKKPTDDSLGSTTYQYGHVLNELFPKNATSDEAIKEPATQPVQEKQTDLTDIYELAEKDGIKIRTSADTNRYQGSKILINTLLLHTSFIWFAVYVAMVIGVQIALFNSVNVGFLVKSSLYIGVIPALFLLIFIINSKHTVKDLFRFKNVIEIALTLTITTIIIVIAIANLRGLDYMNIDVLFTNVIYPVLIATLIPVFFIIEYLLAKLSFYHTV